jgi:predicted nucleic acid-binding protein
VTTTPVLTEALYFLGKRGGWFLQATLWRMRAEGSLEVVPLESSDLDRTAELMDKYSDVPMDFADASLVALAESRGEKQIFTLDRHFRAYRLPNRRVFHIVPEDV